ncbi:MAG: response regulator [Myxococcota bacterium]
MAAVLIVDDEENHRRSLAIGLRLESFEVHEAADGEEALRIIEGGAEVDVAIVDLMMPGINGLDLTRRLRTHRPDVRVVLTSAYHLSERQIERADVGAMGFLPKPYHLDDLVGFLRRKLDSIL